MNQDQDLRETMGNLFNGSQDGGTKYDKGKIRFDLIPPYILEGLAAVFTFGVKKYADDNWAKGISVRRLYSSLQRHDQKFYEGEDLDQESGMPHMFHVMWNAGAIAWMVKYRPSYDDRPLHLSTVEEPNETKP